MERRWRDNNTMRFRDAVNQVTAEDRSHNLTFACIWDLPFGKGRAFRTDMNKAGRIVPGGWTATTNFIYQTGVPLGAWTGWEFLCRDPLQTTRTETMLTATASV